MFELEGPYSADAPWLWPDELWRRQVERVRAGRSLKPQAWKDGARMAVALSFDADHETFELRNGGRSAGRLSQGQYGARAGMPRILRLLEKYGVPASFFVPAVSAMINAEEVRNVAAAGHEIGIHGWIHEFNSALDADTERDLTLRAADVLERLSGARPVGMRTASWDFSPATLGIAREMALLYDSSLMADDEPYELLEDGQPTGIVEIPVEWIRDDAPYFAMDRMSAARPYGDPLMVLGILQRELEMAYQEGGLFQLTLHPHHSGHRSRLFLLEEVIRLAQSKGDVWFTTHADLAAFCAASAGLERNTPR
ncbi:polysaccharide deacetylase [Brenneria goodwinii]|uniref:Polysaccharide deacetylase n=1 Tax=Brenneria goodwinii TaxID=1109412 RepID=A0AAE8JM04_9GAMM|nr:polysaccharide deacetylase [Brenneria goodwinii]ATA23670.1 polysaccharide deacetylase [Brenneria goodwinii]MCG8154685.1 polysaccharide deacetylase [Brenneria goodwinii]MCG8159979.1 polysaccharide deacetylase [Brenneria goodwinii]MCG8163923.1 polysaccharide deacetylase [Brenneria goodwinii]MCG8168532.1 polysaccharide deacetylase [Brenneria goodwinii]